MNDNNLPAAYYSGISGLQLPVPKYLLPAEFQSMSRLAYYSTLLNSIEFNSSFYKIPQKKTVEKWAASVGNDFHFTFKLWKQITHNKKLAFDNQDVDNFIQTIEYAGDKKGCLLIQFPPALDNDHIHQLDNLLNRIKISDPHRMWRIAVEFRNRGWYNEDVYDILHTHKAAIVIHDIPKSATPSVDSKADFKYIRFHGPTGNYRGSYPDEFLQEYAHYINEWLGELKTVYVYFNNTMGAAYNNLMTLNGFLKPTLRFG